MSIKGRKMFGFILTNVLILLVTILTALIAPEVFGEWAFVGVITGLMLNNLVFVLGNVFSKLFTPDNIKELLIKNG